MRMPTTRYDILDLLPPGPITGVEIGTDTGINARELLLQRRDLFLWTVDPYLPTKYFPDAADPGRAGAQHWYLERVGEFIKAGRSKHLKMASIDAAKEIQRMGVVPDFVYIDGCHEDHSVREDITSWYPVLRVGGVMAGHDFANQSVHTPVIQFAKILDLDLQIINEHNYPGVVVPAHLMGPGATYDKHGGWCHPSWWWYKKFTDEGSQASLISYFLSGNGRRYGID
jgi:hypothetical protein